MLTERNVRALLETDGPVERMFLNDEFEVWAVGDDLVAKFPRTEIDAAKVPVEAALHPTIRGLLGDVVPAIRMVGTMEGAARRFIVQERATGSQGQTVDGVTVSPGEGLPVHIGSLFGALHRVSGSRARELGAGERTLSFAVPPISDEALAATTEIAGAAVRRFLAEPPPNRPTAERCATRTSRANMSSSMRGGAG